MWRSGRTDGFQLLSAISALLAGPIMLVAGAPAGWSLLLIAVGIVLLLALWAIDNDIEFAAMDRPEVIAAVVGVAALWLAIVYLTRAADDLPRLLPGHDSNSERFVIVPGLVTLTVGTVLLGRAVARSHPRRAHH